MNDKPESLAGLASPTGVSITRIIGDDVVTLDTTTKTPTVANKAARSKLIWIMAGAGIAINMVLVAVASLIIGPLSALVGLFLFNLIFNFKSIIASSEMRKWHGAEHRALRAYEENKMDEVRTGARISTLHKLCGTNLITLSILLQIAGLMYLFNQPQSIGFWTGVFLGGVATSVAQVISFYLVKYIRHPFSYPGVIMQKLLTVREPELEKTAACLDVIERIMNPVTRKSQLNDGIVYVFPGEENYECSESEMLVKSSGAPNPAGAFGQPILKPCEVMYPSATVSPSPHCKYREKEHDCHCIACGKIGMMGQQCCGRELTGRTAGHCRKTIPHPKERYKQRRFAD